MEQWLLPLAFIGGMFLLHRFLPGGCCGGHAHRRDDRVTEREKAAREPDGATTG